MSPTQDELARVWGAPWVHERAPRLLGVFSHPDDEVFCGGGTFARAAAAGAVTAILSLTQGERGEIRDVATATRRTLGTVRAKELEHAATALGVDHITCLDLPDGRLDARPVNELASVISEHIDAFGPDVVITFGPDGAFGHPDHIASCVATMEAIRGMPEPPRLLHASFPMHEQLMVDVLVEWLTSTEHRFNGTAGFGHALKLFADASSMLGFAADHLAVEWFPAGSFIIEQGEPATALFCILSGTVDIVVEGEDGGMHRQASAGAGSFVGEAGLATGRPRNAHVIAGDDVTCLVFSPGAPRRSAGRGAGAAATTAPSSTRPATASIDSANTKSFTVDVGPMLERKVAALAAHRSQYAMGPDLFPPPVFERLLGVEHFAVAHVGARERSRVTRYEPAGLASAETEFRSRYPAFDRDGAFAELRRSEYGRLDADGHVYLDYTGGSLYAASQVDVHADLLRKQVLGNPHSANPTSLAASAFLQRAREVVCEYFNAPPDEYLCIFTANATAALRLVGEAYPFRPGGTFGLTFDNHNSVNGIREFARRKGADIEYVPVVAPELRIDRTAMREALQAADPSAHNLFAFPAQSNFSGVQHPLDLVDEAHEAGWDVLVDAAAFAPTNRFDVERVRPDFATFSFYKISGFPTGVGCLLMRRDRIDRMERPWFAGGTVTIASVQGDGHYLHRDEAGFEDGTVDYLNIPAVETGLRHLERIGRDAIHRRVSALTEWLLASLTGLRHSNGRSVVRILGPTDTAQRGGTVTFLMRDPDGRLIDDRRIEELAQQANISLRTGCFCNPGAGEIAHHLGAAEMRKWFGRDEPMSFLELRECLDRELDRFVAAIRISVGVATNFADVYRFMCFVRMFVDRTVDEIARAEFVLMSDPNPTQGSQPR
jgi:molybdenum cofactor sulfurtransferase